MKSFRATGRDVRAVRDSVCAEGSLEELNVARLLLGESLEALVNARGVASLLEVGSRELLENVGVKVALEVLEGQGCIARRTRWERRVEGRDEVGKVSCWRFPSTAMAIARTIVEDLGVSGSVGTLGDLDHALVVLGRGEGGRGAAGKRSESEEGGAHTEILETSVVLNECG